MTEPALPSVSLDPVGEARAAKRGREVLRSVGIAFLAFLFNCVVLFVLATSFDGHQPKDGPIGGDGYPSTGPGVLTGVRIVGFVILLAELGFLAWLCRRAEPAVRNVRAATFAVLWVGYWMYPAVFFLWWTSGVGSD